MARATINMIFDTIFNQDVSLDTQEVIGLDNFGVQLWGAIIHFDELTSTLKCYSYKATLC